MYQPLAPELVHESKFTSTSDGSVEKDKISNKDFHLKWKVFQKVKEAHHLVH